MKNMRDPTINGYFDWNWPEDTLSLDKKITYEYLFGKYGFSLVKSKGNTSSGETAFLEKSLPLYVIGRILADDYFNDKSRSINMNTDLEKANLHINERVESINKNLKHLTDKESEFVTQSKKISSGIRKHSQSMVDGITRIKKSASFDELEQYTSVLERYVIALEKLDGLEQSGHLGKILKAFERS
jgi:hypothetical protein